jgi:putative glutamine amidotransferase
MKTIGIVGRTHYEGYFGAHNMYMKYFAGLSYPLVLPNWDSESLIRFIHKNVDLVVLPGGPDILSASYKEHPHYFAGSAQPQLEYFDWEVLPHIIHKVPIFGICRGMQAINVCLGGTLLQHLRKHPQSKERSELIHDVSVRGYKQPIRVNSLHHQAIHMLSHDLEVFATASDMIIEAVIGDKIAAVQWHPEEIVDPVAGTLLMSLLRDKKG